MAEKMAALLVDESVVLKGKAMDWMLVVQKAGVSAVQLVVATAGN